MAKGQQRSNREVRKPKKAKKPKPTDLPIGSPVKHAGSGIGLNRKGKK